MKKKFGKRNTKMTEPRVEVFYSLQSDYCYFLLDRLLKLNAKGVEVVIRPVLGGVLRMPEKFSERDKFEQNYFVADTMRVAEYLNLPYEYPDPSPIEFKRNSLWIAEAEQPRNENLYQLFVGSVRSGNGLNFLDKVSRCLWDGSTPGWDHGDHLRVAMAEAGLSLAAVLQDTPWTSAKSELDQNAEDMLKAGHWGVPLLVFNGEPFYGQDRFDLLLWRMKNAGALK